MMADDSEKGDGKFPLIICMKQNEIDHMICCRAIQYLYDNENEY